MRTSIFLRFVFCYSLTITFINNLKNAEKKSKVAEYAYHSFIVLLTLSLYLTIIFFLYTTI